MGMNPRLLRPLASGFSPRQIAGLGAWFDASDLSTLSQTSNGATPVTANNDPVAYFKCKVTGTPLTQAVDASRPLWKASALGGKPGLDFDGINDNLFATSGGLMDVARNLSGATAFFVSNIDSTAINRPWWTISIGAATNFFRLRSGVVNLGVAFTAGNRRLDADTSQTLQASFSPNTSYISRVTYDYANASLQIHLNGTLGNSTSSFQTAGNTSDTASAYVMLGNQFTNEAFTTLASPFVGIICEWLVYQRALTAAESSRVEGYLSNKYGIAVA